MKIIDYHCVYAGNSQMLGVKVGQFIMRGWQPFGGVSVSTSVCDESVEAELVYAQALVRYKEHEGLGEKGTK